MKHWGIGLCIVALLWPAFAQAKTIIIKKGATSQTIYIDVFDNAQATTFVDAKGGRLTGLAFDTSNLACYYTRPLAAATAITLATQTVTGAYSSGGFVEVSATNAPGQYRLDLPDAVIATGVDRAIVECKGAAAMIATNDTLQLTAADLQTATNLGLSALPTANPGAANGVFIAGTNAATTVTTALTTTFTGNLTGSVASVTGLTASDVGAIKTKTDSLTFTVANEVNANTRYFNGTAATATGGRPEVNTTHFAGTALATVTAGGYLKVDAQLFGGAAGSFAGGRPEVNTSYFGGTAGTFASGIPTANLSTTGNNVLGAAKTITVSGSGSTTSIIESSTMTETSAKSYVGLLGLCATATNTSNRVIPFKIIGFDPATDRIAISPSLAAALTAGDTCNLFASKVTN